MRTRCAVPSLARVLFVVVAAAVALPPAAPALAAPEDDLRAAQREANAAAAELSQALEEMARADDAVAQLQDRVANVERRLEGTRDQVRQLAIRLYVDGTGTLSRLLRMTDANQMIRAQQFGHVLAGTSTDALRQYRADREDLRIELAALDEKQQARAGALENLRHRQANVMEEVERLTLVAAQARAAEQARAAREEQAAPAAQPPAGGQPSPGSPGLTAAAPAPTAAAPAALPPPPTTAARGEDPAPAPAPTAASGDWICPVQGPHAFSNDWGAARGGGFSHQGNDILAAKGTPVVANVSGFVTHRTGAISGLAYYLDGDDGNEYFGAHLDSFGASGRVSAGTQIGTVGDTGDAAGGPPHLHFEIHPGGGAPINPYPTLLKYC